MYIFGLYHYLKKKTLDDRHAPPSTYSDLTSQIENGPTIVEYLIFFLCMFMCIYIYVCMYAGPIYIYTYMYTHTYIFIYIYIYVCIYVQPFPTKG